MFLQDKRSLFRRCVLAVFIQRTLQTSGDFRCQKDLDPSVGSLVFLVRLGRSRLVSSSLAQTDHSGIDPQLYEISLRDDASVKAEPPRVEFAVGVEPASRVAADFDYLRFALKSSGDGF